MQENHSYTRKKIRNEMSSGIFLKSKIDLIEESFYINPEQYWKFWLNLVFDDALFD